MSAPVLAPSGPADSSDGSAPTRGRRRQGAVVRRTQFAALARRPSRLLLTGLAVLVAAFVVYATVLAQQVTQRTVVAGLSGTSPAADLVVSGAVPPAVLARVAAVPGVAEAVGRASTSGTVAGTYLSVTADPGRGPLAQVAIVSGRYPTAPGEVAVTPRTADRLGLTPGTTATLALDPGDASARSRVARLTVVGVVRPKADDGSTAYAPLSTLTRLSGTAALDQVDVRLVPGAAAGAVRQRVEAVVAAAPSPSGERLTVTRGDELRLQEARAAASDVDDLFAVVGAFVAVAVVAAVLVATSTFRIVFAQRMRQLALLRAVGAGRGALTRALVAEGVVTGLVAGVAGVLLALALGQAAPLVAGRFGVALSGPGVPLGAAAAVVALSVAVTAVAVLAPAASAARVAPLEALRAVSTTGARRGIGRIRWAVGAVLAAGAGLLVPVCVATAPDPDAQGGDPTLPLLLAVASGALAFAALVALGPVLVRPLLGGVGRLLHGTGPVGRLAVGGVGSAPRRAAAVGVVVALGVALVAGALVGNASLRTLADRETAAQTPADFDLRDTGGSALPATVLERARGRSELAHVTDYRRLPDVHLGGRAAATAADLDLTALPALERLGPDAGVVAPRPGRVTASAGFLRLAGLHEGERTELVSGRHRVPVTVATALPSGGPLEADLFVAPADLTRLGAPAAATGLLADAAAPGERARAAARAALRAAAGTTTATALTVLADEREDFERVLNALFAIALGLIGLTVLVAVVGVGTTTALSVVERVRESGLLRALGLSRAGLRVLLTAEAALYGVIGAVAGLALGVPYAWLAVHALGVGATLELPVPALAAAFALLVTLTALAGAVPAHRAARISPVEATALEV